MNVAPLVVKDKVILGPATNEFGVNCWVAAFDVRTGAELWRFKTVAEPGEPGNETWPGDSWQHGGAPIWVTGSYDPETNLTFWGTGNPNPGWNGGPRNPGDNLFFALDARNGELLWKTNLGGTVSGGPMTYAIDGRQYVAVSADTALYVFGLPE